MRVGWKKMCVLTLTSSVIVINLADVFGITGNVLCDFFTSGYLPSALKIVQFLLTMTL